MIETLTISNFRGFQQLEVGGFRSVNLIIGKNNSGKTALLEAVALASVPVADTMRTAQSIRLGTRSISALQFERYWAPFFFSQDSTKAISLHARTPDSSRVIEIKRANLPVVLPADGGDEASSWQLNFSVHQGQSQTEAHLSPDGNKLVWTGTKEWGDALWCLPHRHMTSLDLKFFSKLKMLQQDGVILDLLRLIDPRIEALEILSPSGSEAEFFVRKKHPPSLLPLFAAGDGFQRCLEISLALSAMNGVAIFIDEIENGFHHSILEPVWGWLGKMATSRGVQLFATTHSEECIAAACRAFKAGNKDDFRVIRLDPGEGKTTAAVYDCDLVEAAMAMDVELRG